MFKKIIHILQVILISFILCSCSFHAGGPYKSSKPTIGQELSDLNRAYEMGHITEAEYETVKAKIVHGR